MLTVAAIVAGAIASVTGFGIGSLLTPLVNLRDEMALAVAVVSIPHFVATALRLWMLRRDIDPRVLKSFGVMSAAGGLLGALLQRHATSPTLVFVFAVLLTLAGLAELTGFARRVRFGRMGGWIAGVLSGALGGLVGNQGGIRSAALLGFEMSPAAFVATATAAGLMVDVARMPVYVTMQRAHLIERADVMAVTTIGAVAGTLVGKRMLTRIPAARFRKVVGALVLALGVYMFTRA